MLTLKNVTNRLWDKPILKNINWETELGQSWAILGPNGAGKSTLGKLILGELPYCGEFSVMKKFRILLKLHMFLLSSKRFGCP
ncbi:MAG: hypothetical protein CM1200mP28_13000 [Deltaproteobacteria bacterium]|nr:MAG: hypothetical protein CM1200mP28_13000 [Deltaproteobacteria bacterium]